ncbi:MAG: shikimate dehydrogenase [Spirochaetales bacterium]
MIVLSTTAPTVSAALDQVRRQRQYLGGVELRIDLLDQREHAKVEEFLQAIRAEHPGLATICTVRRLTDGGSSDDSDERRLSLLATASAAGTAYIDLEGDLPDSHALQNTIKVARDQGTRIIWSMHDFEGVPLDLNERLSTLCRTPDGIPKIAVRPNGVGDLLRLLEVAREHEGQKIIVGMGAYGAPTRLAPYHFESMLSFCSSPGASAAPGHVTPQTLTDLYQVGKQRSSWPLFAVIGNPIAHSKSPAYHNGRFMEDGIDAAYIPVLVDEPSQFFALAELLPILGFSVTIPHKEAVIEHLDEVSPEVRAARACNTVVRAPSGWLGLSTDTIGFLAPLEEQMGSRLRGSRVLVLGAGGAARGVAFALLEAGSEVLVHNRTHTKAETLAAEIATFGRSEVGGSVRAVEQVEAVRTSGIEVIVNTTSVGMHGDGDPAAWYRLDGTQLVYDIVYTPPETPLIRRALAGGCRVITGDMMFSAQAAAQYELYRTLATGGA